jgi:uncharacterized protein
MPMTPPVDSELTGNDYITVAAIARDVSLDGVTVLHGGVPGLVEWAGAPERPLFRLSLSVGGETFDLGGAGWRRLDRWIPAFSAQAGDVTVSGLICAPAGYPVARGFYIRLDVEHGQRMAVDVSAALHIDWTWSRRWIASGRPLPGNNRLRPVGGGISLETDDGRGPALTILPGGAASVAGSAADGATAANGTVLSATLTQSLTAVPKRRAAVTFYVGAGREADGATAAAASMRRRGADELLRQARLELSHTLRAGQDHRWADMLNRNLLFSRYFAAGRGIDDDQLWLLRSRSPACPAPALFNEREALFWTLPALIAADPGIAREALLRCFDLYSERSGEYLRYLDGGAFDSGFVLEQFLLYAWAVDRYVSATGDASVLDEPVVQQVIMETDNALYMRLHPEHLLCSTELLPSGDPADHPCPVVGNALVKAFADALPRLWPKSDGADDPPPRFEGVGSEVAAAVWQHCVADVGGEQLLASSSDLAGGAAVYDDPSMSLALLPVLGFCSSDDPVWSATMEFLRSGRYPLWRPGAVPGIAHRARPAEAALAALVADLLTPAKEDALRRLLGLRLPAGLAVETYDPVTGEGHAATACHAALAGFLAWALIAAAEPPPQAGRRRR